MENLIIISLVGGMGLLGIFFVGIALAFQKSEKRKKKKCTVQTIGTVIRTEMHTSSDGFSTPTVSWFPVYEYYADGHRIEKRSNIGHAKQAFYDGQKVEILYDPLNDNEYYVPEAPVKGVAIIFGTIGTAFMICSLAACVLYFKFIR